MILETIIVIAVFVLTIEIWLPISLVWAFIKGLIYFITGLVGWLGSQPLDWGIVWLIPVTATGEAFTAGWSIPVWIWNFAIEIIPGGR